MEPPKSQTAFDPNRSVFNTPAARFTYLELENPLLSVPQRGKKVLLKINSATHVVEKIDDNPYPGSPQPLPPELMAVPQPHIMTCGLASSLGGNAGLGCDAAVNGGCQILLRYGRVGPFNMIVEKDGKVDSAPCHKVYCGMTNSGRPTSQVHMLLDGWNVLTDRTTVPENVRENGEPERVRYTEVPHLAPFYEELKVGRFTEAEDAPKRRGRKPGSRNKPKAQGGDREDRPAAAL
jgi:hypothetical protein